LAYPLDVDQRPDAEKKPLGRFLAEQDGYLETSDFTQGRLITVRGTLKDKRKGYIGDVEYTYPVVRINQLHLWSKQRDFSEPRIQFGIGIMFHN
jgi:outer membrane lipoprotein